MSNRRAFQTIDLERLLDVIFPVLPQLDLLGVEQSHTIKILHILIS